MTLLEQGIAIDAFEYVAAYQILVYYGERCASGFFRRNIVDASTSTNSSSWTSSYFEHLYHCVLQQTHVVVNEHPLVDSASLAHQADQREMTIHGQYDFPKVVRSQERRHSLGNFSCVDVSVAISFESDNALADALIFGICATDRPRASTPSIFGCSLPPV
jgi:hypothetical protein